MKQCKGLHSRYACRRRILGGYKLEYNELFSLITRIYFVKRFKQKKLTQALSKFGPEKGSIAQLESYSSGIKDGDFFEYHDNGKLKSKRQYKMGMRHGYHFYEWLTDGTIYSRKYYQRRPRRFWKIYDEEFQQLVKVWLHSS